MFISNSIGVIHSLHTTYEPKKRIWLADKCKVHWRTIQRDIIWMKTHGAHIGSDKKRGYYFKDKAWILPRPPMIITQELLSSLLIAKKAITHHAGTPLEMTLQRLFESLSGKIMSDLSFGGVSDPSNAVAFSPSRAPAVKPEVWQVVFDGITQHHTIEITYQGWKDSKPLQRQVNPCQVACLDGVWYLFASAPERSELRQYALHRMYTARVTKIAFSPETQINKSTTAENSFNRFSCIERNEQLHVRFDKEIANLVIGYRWHPKQKTRILKRSGDIVVSFPISTAGPWKYYHVLRWVLSFGKHVEVLKPVEVRAEIRNAARQIIKKHS